MKKENRLFVSLYSEDDFNGITIPMELSGVIDYLSLHTVEIIDEVFVDYDEYRDCEVEISSQARHGSRGTTDIDTIEDLKEELSWNDEAIQKIEEYETK